MTNHNKELLNHTKIHQLYKFSIELNNLYQYQHNCSSSSSHTTITKQS